jgi:hypothetical protein
MIIKTIFSQVTKSVMWAAVFVTVAHAEVRDKATLSFVRASDSEFFFNLKNPTTHAVYFRGTKSFWVAPTPLETSYECQNPITGKWTVSGFPLMDPIRPGYEAPHIEVAPGKTIKLKLKIAEALGNSPEQFKGSSKCRIRIRLVQADDEYVESQYFRP